MSRSPFSGPRKGIAWRALAICALMSAGGLALSRDAGAYWIIEPTGAAAGIGAVAAVFVMLATAIGRLLLRRRTPRATGGA